MNTKVVDLENRLRMSTSMHSLAEAMRDALTSSTLGKHMPRYYVPYSKVSDAAPNLMNTLSLEGVKDGKALFEIRPCATEIRKVGPFDFLNFSAAIRAPFIGKPWLRALVPLQGTVEGTIIQLRQPPTFRSSYIGFVRNEGVARRGVFSRHVDMHDVGNGAVNSTMPATMAYYGSDTDGVPIAIPIDSFVTLKLALTIHSQFVPQAIAGVLVPTETTTARRVERRQMREAAHEYMSRTASAVSVIDLHGRDAITIANTLQDILGLNQLMPDYHYRCELEASSGRIHRGGGILETEYAAAVLAGALHAGARTEFFSEDDAKLFIAAVNSFSKILRAKEDKVFQANTLFSSVPSPTNQDHYAALHKIANGDIKSI